MKKVFAVIALLAVLALMLCGCGGKKYKTVEEIQKAGKLVVGTSADFSPYEFHILKDGVDTIVGFDMQLAKAIADELGVELEIVDQSFDSILLDLNAGSIDLGIAGFSPDPERAKEVDFSDIYYEGGQSFAINKADAGKYDSFDDFKGLQVGAQTGSIQATLLEENCPDCEPVLLQNVGNIILELNSGNIAGAFIETVVLENYIKNYPDLVEMCAVPYDVTGSAVAIAKGNDTLTEVVNKVVAESISSNDMAKWIEEANDLADQSIS